MLIFVEALLNVCVWFFLAENANCEMDALVFKLILRENTRKRTRTPTTWYYMIIIYYSKAMREYAPKLARRRNIYWISFGVYVKICSVLFADVSFCQSQSSAGVYWHHFRKIR